MRLLAFGAAALAVACAACSTEVIYRGAGSGGGGSGATSSAATNVSTTTTTSSGGSPGCGRTHDRFELKLELGTGQIYGCGSGGPTGIGLTIEGRVVHVSRDQIVVDSCPPEALCQGALQVLTFSAPGLLNPVPPDAFVRVQVAIEQPWACTQALQIVNLPEWEGWPNPVVGGSPLWLAAADGVTTTLAGAPFNIGTVALGCVGEVDSCGPIPDDYALSFEAPGAKNTALVRMGEAADWLVEGPEPHNFVLRNLRSFETGACDDYWNWGWWAAEVVVVPF
jgi:hypothetical protein